MIRRETDYAIRAVLWLARNQALPETAPVSTKYLADITGVPYRFLRKIVLNLSHAGILTSRKGKKGGLTLRREPQHISLLDLLLIVEPDSVFLNQCTTPEANSCQHQDNCGFHHVLGNIQQVLQVQLADISLQDMTAVESSLI